MMRLNVSINYRLGITDNFILGVFVHQAKVLGDEAKVF